MSYNERIFNVLLEAGACHSKKVNKDECVETCENFDDTIGNDHNFSKVTVPSGLKFSEESVPVCKTTKKNVVKQSVAILMKQHISSMVVY